MNVIWHDLECGSYGEDLPLWRSLASEEGERILEVGAGTGRVALDLAHRGHRVTALDHDAELIRELRRRAAGLEVETVVADARSFELPARFGLCLVPMQTIQLLGGPEGRASFLACARAQLLPRGLLAVAITTTIEAYEINNTEPGPVPDMCERDGVVYCSHPTAVRADDDGFVLERRRETVTADGRRTVEHNAIKLDRLAADELEREGAAAGLRPQRRATVPATVDYFGSEVVMLRG